MNAYSTLECTWLLFITCWAVCRVIFLVPTLHILLLRLCWSRKSFLLVQGLFSTLPTVILHMHWWFALRQVNWIWNFNSIFHFACIKHFCSCNVVASELASSNLTLPHYDIFIFYYIMIFYSFDPDVFHRRGYELLLKTLWLLKSSIDFIHCFSIQVTLWNIMWTTHITRRY